MTYYREGAIINKKKRIKHLEDERDKLKAINLKKTLNISKETKEN